MGKQCTSAGDRMYPKIPALFDRLTSNRELLVLVPVYFFLSLTNLILKLRETVAWTNGVLVNDHKALLAFEYYNNEQSRLFQFLIPEFIHRTFSLSIESSYALARLLFVFMAFLVFHLFLRKWFKQAASFAGVLILSGSMAITFLVGDLQESAPLMMLLFVLGLWAIREEKEALLGLFLLLGGGLTNETMLVLAAGYFFYRLPSARVKDIARTGFRTTLIALPALLTQGVIRYINRNQPHLGDTYQLPENLLGIWNEIQHPVETLFQGKYVYFFLIFSIFWIFAVLGYPKSPRFLRSVFWIVPLFLAAHLITGIVSESRQMIPLAYILIPMSLFFIFPEASPETKRS